MEDEKILSKFKGEKILEKGINGEVIREYTKLEYVGKGFFQICYKVYLEQKEKKVYLVKEMLYNEATYREARLHSELYHKNIVKLYHYFTNDYKTLYLILDYCENRDLSMILEKRKRLTEIEVQYYIINLIKALQYLHYEKRIVHCDLKPSNIFLTDKLEVKLGDFGLAKIITLDFTPNYYGGTVYYMAPELFEINKMCSFSIDIWSIGIIMYNLLTGKVPFHGKDRKETVIKIINENCEFPQDIIISEIAKDLIIQILNKDPQKRPSLGQILHHQFFRLGRSIPKLLPKAFAHKEPSINYIRNFIVDADENGIIKQVPENLILINIETEETKRFEKETIEKIFKKTIYVKECFLVRNFNKKFDLVYTLNNDLFCIYFNDSTKLYYSKTSNYCFYINNNNERNIININDKNAIKREKYDKDLEKKVLILKYYIKYNNENDADEGYSENFEGNKYNKNNNFGQIRDIISNENDTINDNKNEQDLFKYEKFYQKKKTIVNVMNDSFENESTKKENLDERDFHHSEQIFEDELIYVEQYYIKDKGSIILRLNNRNIQVFFNQNDSALILKEKNLVILIKRDKGELKHNFVKFDKFIDIVNMEIFKELPHTKYFLERILNEKNHIS